ncbi:hypothetical protein ACLI4Y_01340 [Natrialbaceae archaeon A-CW3]
MHATRFVTYCFIYCGTVLFVTQALIYRPDLVVGTILNAGAALCILFTGVHRLYSPVEERNPDSYGLFAYGMAFFALMVTILFLAGVYAVWQ